MNRFSLIGTRLGHSFSAGYFNSRFEEMGIDAHYELHEIPDLSELYAWISGTPDLVGFNVTIPFKEMIIPLLDSLSPLAEEVGAVNTVRIVRDTDGPRKFQLEGFNTDVGGFMDLMHSAGITAPESAEQGVGIPSGGPALVLGSGGASKAAEVGLRRAGFRPIVVSRTRGKGDTVYADLKPEMIQEAKVIVQTTPLGMWPDVTSVPPFPYQYLRGEGQVCLDLVYNPEETLFIKICRAHGAKTAGGLKMLHSQADRAWSIWNLPLMKKHCTDSKESQPTPDHP